MFLAFVGHPSPQSNKWQMRHLAPSIAAHGKKQAMVGAVVAVPGDANELGSCQARFMLYNCSKACLSHAARLSSRQQLCAFSHLWQVEQGVRVGWA